MAAFDADDAGRMRVEMVRAVVTDVASATERPDLIFRATVEVEAGVPLVNTDNGSKGDVVTNAEIVEMPLNNRSFQDLAFLVAGVAEQSDGGNGSTYAVNGARTDNTNFIVDGFSNQGSRKGTPQVSPSLEAMLEFKLQTTGYSAEYGRLSCGVMNMALKTGGNQVHGSVFDFFRNDDLNPVTSSMAPVFPSCATTSSAPC